MRALPGARLRGWFAFRGAAVAAGGDGEVRAFLAGAEVAAAKATGFGALQNAIKN